MVKNWVFRVLGLVKESIEAYNAGNYKKEHIMAQNPEELEHHTGREPQLGGEREERLIRYKIMGREVDVREKDLLLYQRLRSENNPTDEWSYIDFITFNSSNLVELCARTVEIDENSVKDESHDEFPYHHEYEAMERGLEILSRHFNFLSITPIVEYDGKYDQKPRIQKVIVLLSPRE